LSRPEIVFDISPTVRVESTAVLELKITTVNPVFSQNQLTVAIPISVTVPLPCVQKASLELLAELHPVPKLIQA
jgi:hypothetical protein